MIPQIIVSHNVSHPEGVTGRVLCALLTGGSVAWVGAFTSASTLIVIAIERYFAVVYPYGNKGKLTMRKLKVCYSGIKLSSLIERFLIECRKSFRDCFGFALLGLVIGQKNLAPLYQPMRSETKTNRDLLERVFPRLAPLTCICFEF